MNREARRLWRAGIAIVGATALLATLEGRSQESSRERDDIDQIVRGRQLVIQHACGNCHGGADPASDGWLAGWRDAALPGIQDFEIGPFHTYARNLTPDNRTGLGRFTERQIFNALRYGLRPGETPDVEITSDAPGQGSFPEFPKYLAIPMPWTAWRHMPDDDLRAIAAYLKRGVRAVHNRVPDSEGPPDFWASAYTEEEIGTYPPPPFPTARESPVLPADVDLQLLLEGRQLVLEHGCGECHGGMNNPAAEEWLSGAKGEDDEISIGAEGGSCAPEAGSVCFHTRPANLTPDIASGLARFSGRQVFNALRYGLRPSRTPSVVITSGEPGRGNFPAVPHYLAPAMPWMSWRHMSDDDLWAIIAYLQHGLAAVRNDVEESEKPADSWASMSTAEKIGTYPAPPFPTSNELYPVEDADAAEVRP